MIKKVQWLCLELTNCCNFDCAFCGNQFMTRKKGFMDKTLAKRIITEATQHDFCEGIVLHMMGDPLLYADLFEILESAHKINAPILLVTNGSLLKKDVALRIFEYPPKITVISYHTGNKDSFKFRNAPISYEEYQKKIFDFIELKFKLKADTHIEIDSIATRYKHHDRFKIINSTREFKQFEKEWIGFAKYLKKKYSLRQNIPSAIVPGTNYLLEDFTFVLKYTYHLWGNMILPLGTKTDPSCLGSCEMPFTQCSVLWNGDLSPCPLDYNGELVFDNVTHKNLVEAFNSTKAEEIMQQLIQKTEVPQKCHRCMSSIKNMDGTKYVAAGQTLELSDLHHLKIEAGMKDFKQKLKRIFRIST
ncbi:MAG: radical SAM protein [Candidatus Omnitrophica bacterium]|nr:radical SAM protein [Candidatus Omnitrophota bacterium]MDD5670268.1 radical SAM protein [Candidatus Omnitrophota bacterium]